MSSELYDRLQSLRARRREDKERYRRPVGSESSGGADAGRARELASLEGWERVAHNVFRRVTHHSGDDFAWLYERLVAEDAFLLLPGGVGPANIVFYDIETTGLSGGAGTMCFLCGLGRVTRTGLELEQLFAADYDGEPAFLEAVQERFRKVSLAVSYNGKSFDSHVLRNRCILNRIVPAQPEELDLLYPARRLYAKRVERCGLTEVSEHILGITREIDMPGYAVPEAYFAYLADDNDRRLQPLFSHHEHDIIALARLLAEMEREAREEGSGAADRFALARLLLEREAAPEHVQRGERLLTALLADGGGHAGPRVAGYLSRHLRRAGRHQESAAAWRRVLEQRNSVVAGIELSKVLEHRTGELEKARGLLQLLLSWPHAKGHREEIRHRLNRVAAKIARAERNASPSHSGRHRGSVAPRDPS